MTRFGRRALWSGAAAWAVSACLSPTLPLPPPSLPDEIQQIETGLYRIEGRIPEPGRILIWNTRTNDLAGKVTTGEYAVDVRALAGDRMQLWYESGRHRSQSVLFEIPSAVPLDAGTDAGAKVEGAADAAADADAAAARDADAAAARDADAAAARDADAAAAAD